MFWRVQFSAALWDQVRAVDASVGHPVGAYKHSVSMATSEVAASAHRAIVLALCTAEFQSQPKPRGKVGSAQVADRGHFIGTVQQHLHAHTQMNLSHTGHSTAASTERTPAAALRC